MRLKKEDIDQLEQRYRATFINSLAGFRQAVLVGTKSVSGNTNLAIFNSLIHLGANPALYGLISRPDSVNRHTLQNILDTQEYTLNYTTSIHFEKAHQTSARYDKDVSEFEKAGFKELFNPPYYAPFVEDAVVKIAMKFEECIDIKLNGTILIIGSIIGVEIADTMVGPDGFVSLSEEDILICQGTDAYFVSESIGRLLYAKP